VCKAKDYRHDETVYIPVRNIPIEVKISYPEKWTKSNKIIIWSIPPLSNEFFLDPDSITNGRDRYMPPVLRKALLDSGYVNIEYIGRKDSIEFVGRKYSISDSNTKALYKNNFNNYYQAFAGNITPQQIVIRTEKPELYYRLIKCPVLAVQGTDDERIDCYPNIERMEQLLKEGGNLNFQKIILEGYNHNLAKWDGGKNDIEDSVIQKIIKWIDER
jgi:pimeloyl-ACP methyl ester carboxylesterase